MKLADYIQILQKYEAEDPGHEVVAVFRTNSFNTYEVPNESYPIRPGGSGEACLVFMEAPSMVDEHIAAEEKRMEAPSKAEKLLPLGHVYEGPGICAAKIHNKRGEDLYCNQPEEAHWKAKG